MNELVSVIIPTYKREYQLKRAIDSVINQTYKNLEIIIIDDNIENSIEREKTKKIVQFYSDYANIKYFLNEKNIGGALTRNRGIEEARGEYIAFLDDDDEYYSTKIEEQMELFMKDENGDLALVYCYTESFNENNQKIAEYKYDFTGSCLFESMKTCIAATSQWLCKKQCLIEIGKFNDVPSKQDSTLIIKLLSHGYTVNRVPKILVKYNEHSKERISSGGPKNIKGELMLRKFCRERYLNIDKNQIDEIESEFSYRLSKLYIKNKLYKEAISEMKILKKLNKKLYIKVFGYYHLYALKIK